MSATAELFGRLKSALEIIGALTAFVAIVGYMSLRAFLNHLGVTGVDSFPAGLYLFEAYVFIIAAVVVLAPPCALFIALSVPLQAARRRIFEKVNIKSHCPVFTAVLLSFAPIMALVLWWIIQPGNEAIQTLQRSGIKSTSYERYPMLFLVPVWVSFLLALLAGSGSIARMASAVVGLAATSGARLACGTASLVMLWSSIIIFNVHVRDIRLPLVALASKGSPSLSCGLLVLSTDDVYVLWVPGPGVFGQRGLFEQVRRSEVPKVSFGPDLRIRDSDLADYVVAACESEKHIGTGASPKYGWQPTVHVYFALRSTI